MAAYLADNNLLCEVQHGFVEGQSCLANLICFLDEATRRPGLQESFRLYQPLPTLLQAEGIWRYSGIPCTVRSKQVDENLPLQQYPDIPAYIEALARLKAEATASMLQESGELQVSYSSNSDLSQTDHILIAADTLIVLHNKVLGKPKDRQDALDILRKLSGSNHQVITGVCLQSCHPKCNPQVRSFHEITTVEMALLKDEQIVAYVDSGEPMDKAGAYGIQGLGCSLIEKIDGDYFNVVGLPAHRLGLHLLNLLKELA